MRNMIKKLIILLFNFCTVFCIKRHTNYGPVLGRKTPKAQIFLGIPFADANRWEDPIPISGWNDVYDATRVKPMCIQPPCINDTRCVTDIVPESSEDCLFLNIFSPRCTKKHDRKAVMVWIHDGFFVFKTGAGKMYDGENFVSKGNVILVTINYRLGAFGFLYDGDTIKGNFGLQDQIMALEWVKENIRYFGGDPKKVTIFGQSAGASSVAAHLLSSQSVSLFRNAIIQSAPLGVNFKSKSDALAQFNSFATAIGCDATNLSCLRSKNPQAILLAMGSTSTGAANIIERVMPWEPFIDGTLLKYTAIAAAEQKRYADKPIIIGINREEGDGLTVDIFGRTVSEIFFKGVINQWRQNVTESDEIIQRYLDNSTVNQVGSLGDVNTDFVFVCPSFFIAEKLSQSRKIWTYIFNEPSSLNQPPPCNESVCHGNERSFVFNSFDATGLPVTSDERDLSNKIINFWTNFAKYGNPNGKRYGGQYWPRFFNTRQLSIVLQTPTLKVTSAYKADICAFWDTTGYM